MEDNGEGMTELQNEKLLTPETCDLPASENSSPVLEVHKGNMSVMGNLMSTVMHLLFIVSGSTQTDPIMNHTQIGAFK